MAVAAAESSSSSAAAALRLREETLLVGLAARAGVGAVVAVVAGHGGRWSAEAAGERWRFGDGPPPKRTPVRPPSCPRLQLQSARFAAMDPGQKVRKPLYREPGHDRQTTVDSVWRVESTFFGHKVQVMLVWVPWNWCLVPASWAPVPWVQP